MNFSSISTAPSAAVAVVVSGIAFFGISSMAYAQGNNASGQSGYKKEAPGDYSDKNDRIQGHTGEGYGNSPEKDGAKKKRSQQGGSGRYDKEAPGDYSDRKDHIEGHTGEPYSAKDSSRKGRESSEKRNTRNQ
jgi:hypothetical protein